MIDSWKHTKRNMINIECFPCVFYENPSKLPPLISLRQHNSPGSHAYNTSTVSTDRKYFTIKLCNIILVHSALYYYCSARRSQQ